MSTEGDRVVSPRGTYLIIADMLRKERLNPPSSGALPSESTLMRVHRVSRSTVRRALQVLADEGLIRSVPGKGWVPVGDETDRPLVERITSVIAEDDLSKGDPFPSESKLSSRFNASRGAVRHALGQLEGQGVLVAAHGKGRTVQRLPERKEP